MTDKFIPSTQFIEKLPNICVDLELVSVYDMDCYSVPQLLYRLAQKINDTITNMEHNDEALKAHLEDLQVKLEYLLGEGLIAELQKIFEKMYADGTLQALVGEAMVDINRRLTVLEDRAVVLTNKNVYAVDFGVKADGITNDTEALQKAIDSLKPKNVSSLWTIQDCGGTVILPKGTMVIKDTIRLYSNITLKGTNKALYGRVTPNTKILFDADDKNKVAISFVGLDPATGKHKDQLVVTGEEMDAGSISQTWNVKLVDFTLASNNFKHALAINISDSVGSTIERVSFEGFDVDLFASSQWDNQMIDCHSLCNFAHLLLIAGNTLKVSGCYINQSDKPKVSLAADSIMYPYANNSILTYPNTQTGIINTGLHGLLLEKPIIEKVKIATQCCQEEPGTEKFYNYITIKNIHIEHVDRAFVFKNVTVSIEGMFGYITPGNSEYLIEGTKAFVTGTNIQPIKYIKLFKEDIDGSYNFFNCNDEWNTKNVSTIGEIGKQSFFCYGNEAIRKTWQSKTKELIGDKTVTEQYADLKSTLVCEVNHSKLVITTPPESPLDVRYSNTVILNCPTEKTVYGFNARDFQEFTVIAIQGTISLNGRDSGGKLVLKSDNSHIVNPIPTGGVMKFICYDGVCYEVSRSF